MKSELQDNILHQKNGKEFREFELIETGLRVEYLHEGNYSKYDISFEEVDFNEYLFNTKPSLAEVALFFSVVCNVLMIFVFAVNYFDVKESMPNLAGGAGMGITAGIAVWAKHLFKVEYLKQIKGSHAVLFFYRKKEQELVDQFIGQIKQAKKKYFRDKYIRIDEYIPVEQQRHTFLWLYQTEQIDKEELEELNNELDNIKIIKGE